MELQGAIQSEVDSILKNRTWEIINQPKSRTPITTKWLFRIKKNAHGEISNLKVKLVAREFQH